jgi:predicted RNA polymerase sigma factor
MSDTHQAIECVWKIESTRLIAGIARVTRDVGIAEELAQDAMVTALERWPDEGIPENPGAWLMTAAKRCAIDALRRGRMMELKHGEMARELELQQQRLGEALDQALDQVIDDDVLRLIFIACPTYQQTPAYEARNPQSINDRAHLEAFVTDLYHAFLQREPDAEGHCFWSNDACTMLRKHTIRAFEESIEFGRLIEGLYDFGEPDCTLHDPGDGCSGGRIGEICNQ